ncbi:testis-expressed protein 45-like [Gigantopelta aegis]|uniref:testis-expressed protein 45-like n=1 Tax=Gigantopelta aegis TaxID=1735272 RepID=UPI001B88E702|nr:testis-expressed protein 45-like [Gigantopelta aegis]
MPSHDTVGFSTSRPKSLTLSQDHCMTKPPMYSIFKQDYPAYSHYGREDPAVPPKLAEVMHKDDRHFNNRASETVSSYEYRFLEKPVLMDVHTRLSATNFKMDSDTSKFKLFDTTHNSYFRPMMDKNFKRPQPTQNISESHIPNGDQEKEQIPLSDYREKFQGHDTRIFKIVKAPSMHEGGPPTIKGDDRHVHFHTSQREEFPGKWQPRVPSLPAPTGTNVPKGDPDKECLMDTTMRTSFVYQQDAIHFKPYNRSEVSGELLKTNVKHFDGNGTWNDYKSISAEAFKPKTVIVKRYEPKTRRNHSDLPEGDRDPNRDCERMSTTTNNLFIGTHPRGLHNTIISGANIRTKSNVLFGAPTMQGTYYNPTTGSTYQPKSVPYLYNRTKFRKANAIPVKYYTDLVTQPTAWSDYQNPRQDKTNPNDAALENLKKSHIFPPPEKDMFFKTTYRDLYTPKEAEQYSYDSGRLQYSSVPLGTLRKSAQI